MRAWVRGELCAVESAECCASRERLRDRVRVGDGDGFRKPVAAQLLAATCRTSRAEWARHEPMPTLDQHRWIAATATVAAPATELRPRSAVMAPDFVHRQKPNRIPTYRLEEARLRYFPLRCRSASREVGRAAKPARMCGCQRLVAGLVRRNNRVRTQD